MSGSEYVELHCHSFFSLLDGASAPEELVARASELGQRALALTDHDELGGAVRFAQAGTELGVGAVIGVELTVDVGVGRSVGKPGADVTGDVTGDITGDVTGDVTGGPPPDIIMASSRGRSATDSPPVGAKERRGGTTGGRHTHLVLLAQTSDGYANLSTLVTLGRVEQQRGRPSVTLAQVAAHAEGIFALTGCARGWVPSLVADGDLAGAHRALTQLADIFDRRVAVECWDHGLTEERALVRQLIPLAQRAGVPWVVTNDVHYARAQGRIVHDVLSCLRHERVLDEMGTRLRPNAEWHLKGRAQLARRWRGRLDGLRESVRIAESCEFRMKDLVPRLPRFRTPDNQPDDEYLAALVEAGATDRWGGRRTEAHDRQLQHELGMIRRLELAGYFLIVWDIVRYARREGILCQGRGSAANSAVCYCLGITAVDPVAMGLLFERFLSENRREAPDIDLDFAHRERERVIQYVYETYGREHAAMVCEQITYRGRSAVRDAARVLGFSVDQASRLSALSDRFSARSTAEALRAGAGAEASAQREAGGARDFVPISGEMVPLGAVARGMMMSGGGAPAHSTPAAGTFAVSGTVANATVTPDAVARTLGDAMVRGTEATTRAAAVKRETRAAYGSHGSAGAHAAATRTPAWLDPHANAADHTERRNPTTALRTAGANDDGLLARAGLDPADPRVRVLADVVDGLHQVPRHRSIHSGGFVLTREPLSRVVPIEPASMPGRTVIQWEKDDLDPVRLVKIDLLGLGMLTALQDCLKYIRETRGIALDLATIPQDDAAVYDSLCRADTIGVFQVESRAQQNTLPRLKPRKFYDLVVEVALIRPGPIQGDMVHPYLRRRAGIEPIEYPHPSLEPILRRTLGIPLFQEQGMQVAIACAGFTPGEADELRRAMGHKRSRERMAEICERLVSGMQRNGIPEETARRIYNQINAFADYGFPESHAASFALLVYASAYLRYHYAPEFTAALLNAQPMGFYSPGTIVEDARRHDVEVRPVDLTRSQWDATLEPSAPHDAPWNAPWNAPSGDGMVGRDSPSGGIVVSGGGPREPATGVVIAPPSATTQSEPMTQPAPATQSDAPRRNARVTRDPSLGGNVPAGGAPPGPAPTIAPTTPTTPTTNPTATAPSPRPPALRLGLRSIRGLGPVARERLERALADGPFTSPADVVHRTALDRRALRLLAEAGAFDAMFADLPLGDRRRHALWAVLEAHRGPAGPLAPLPPARSAPPLPTMRPADLTAADYRVTGLSLLGHPMRHLRATVAPNGIRTARDLLERGVNGERIGTAGLVICRQRPGTARGFVFLSLEDETGIINVVVTPKQFEQQAIEISTSPLLLVRGTLQVEGGGRERVVNVRGDRYAALDASVGAEWARGHDFH